MGISSSTNEISVHEFKDVNKDIYTTLERFYMMIEDTADDECIQYIKVARDYFDNFTWHYPVSGNYSVYMYGGIKQEISLTNVSFRVIISPNISVNDSAYYINLSDEDYNEYLRFKHTVENIPVQILNSISQVNKVKGPLGCKGVVGPDPSNPLSDNNVESCCDAV